MHIVTAFLDARLIAAALAALLFAGSAPATVPAETRVQLGVGADSVDEVKAAGATPAFAGFWVGDWMADSGWGALERMLDRSRASGITPVLYWYYWGDSISPACVEDGCDGRTRAEWDALTTTLASKIKKHMRGALTYVVLENEFNKGNITGAYAATFDAYLEAKAKELKDAAGAKIILGYGAWGEVKWGSFPKAIAASDLIGFQMMRASTRDSEIGYRNAPDRMEALVARAREIAPTKGSFLYDLALSSHGGARWAQVQEETMAAIILKGNALAAHGLQGIVYREIRDDPGMSPENYFGIAEQRWGLKDRDGNAKPVWATWLAAAKGETVAPPPRQPFAATFAPRGGNEWWVEAKVEANAPLARVCASIDGGPCQPLEPTRWGTWAASIHAPAGARVRFEGTAVAGETIRSAGYAWPVP